MLLAGLWLRGAADECDLGNSVATYVPTTSDTYAFGLSINGYVTTFFDASSGWRLSVRSPPGGTAVAMSTTGVLVGNGLTFQLGIETLSCREVLYNLTITNPLSMPVSYDVAVHGDLYLGQNDGATAPAYPLASPRAAVVFDR
jgi:hypothetical protein